MALSVCLSACHEMFRLLYFRSQWADYNQTLHGRWLDRVDELSRSLTSRGQGHRTDSLQKTAAAISQQAVGIF